METLDELIEEAYRLFAGYEMGDELGVCTACCVNERDAKLLKTLKPQEMSRELIFQYLDAAAYPDRPSLIPEMKHLMPRVLQLLVQGEYIRHSTEITLDKCFCERAEWSAAEIDFMQRFALTYFDKQLKSYSTAVEAQDVLIMFHLAGLNVTPLLNYWRNHMANPMAVWGVVSLIESFDQKGRYSHPFSDAEFSALIACWLGREETREVIRTALLEQIEVLTAAGLAVDSCEMIFDWI
jgi:hypothetical protein